MKQAMISSLRLQPLLLLGCLVASAHGSDNATSAPTHGYCREEAHPFDPFIHKSSYVIGVHAIRGLDEALAETNMTFGEYLTATAGRRFDPPIEFEVRAKWVEEIFEATETEELDFLYSNPGVYSCVGTELGATALTTAVKRSTVRDKTFELDVYGGVIAVRADNVEVNSVKDLKDKIIGAGAIVDLMAGQMQIYEMIRAGLSYVNDPRMVVFTKNQEDVVKGVLDGTFDVGFISTDQIETTRDDQGKLLDPGLFKVIEPKIYVMDNGDLFPFLHSTEVFPEWPLAAMPSVPADVALEVQDALLSLSQYARVGEEFEKCSEVYGEEQCELIHPHDFYREVPCDTTLELAELAFAASKQELFAGFRTSRSYHGLRTMQQEAGFMVQDDEGNYYCTRPSNLYEVITCPEGYFKRGEDEFLNGCAEFGLSCDQKEEYDCFCKPCVRAFDVDVYPHEQGDDDLHLVEHYGDELPGCQKMSICAEIEQGESVTLRIYDNESRDDADVEVVAHAGDEERALPVRNIEGTYAYEITISDVYVQTQVIDVKVNGEPISQSPVRVMVVPKDCDAIYGEGALLKPNGEGDCVCQDNTYEIGNTCVESHFFFLMIFGAAFAGMAVLVMVFLHYKKSQNDALWQVSVDELHLNEPPEVVGQGAFGVVVLGQYRGTKVAVKRVLPPQVKTKNGSRSGSIQLSGSLQIQNGKKVGAAKSQGTKGSEDVVSDKKAVQFSGTPETDIEAAQVLKSGSISMSNNKAWEDLLLDDHKYNSALKILESATLSNRGSSTGNFVMSKSRSRIVDMLPLWLRFDEHSRLRQEFLNEMRLLSRLRHPCITTVMGAVIAPRVDPMLVMEYMEYGSLYDLLRNETMYAGGEIILQIVKDVTQGINFLHSSRPPILHGDLKAKNILVDSRFRAKVADFGFSHIKTSKTKNVLQGTPYFMAPEYLKRKSEYTTQCDMYSYGMILFEIYARHDPFEGEDPRVVLPKVCHPRINKRPAVPEACPPKMADIMKKCWSSNPFFRPSAKDVDYILVEMSTKEAEPMGQAQQGHLQKNKPTSLYDVFPKHIADALNAGKKVEPESHEIVTVVFSDIVGFTTISQTFEPIQVSKMLDRLYHAFDAIARKHGVFKVETIGDAYMGVTNLTGEEFETHVKQVAEYAIDIIAAANKILIDEEAPEKGTVKIRVGFHSGPIVSNVIGSLNPRYGLFGDTVNTASRMESNSVVGRVQCTHASAQLLMQQAPELPVTLRGKINVKGKGKMMTYWVGDEIIRAGGLDPIPDASESGAQLEDQDLTDVVADLANIEDDGNEDPDDDIPDSVGTPKTEISDAGSYGSDASIDNDDKVNEVSDIFLRVIKKIMATRRTENSKRKPAEDQMIKAMENYVGTATSLVQESSEYIDIPTKNGETRDLAKIVLEGKLQSQVHKFVEVIAEMYKSNKFHNFEHAAHVVKSMNRFFSQAEKILIDGDDQEKAAAGLVTDKVSQFATLMSALIHDVDHRGMPNACLAKADPKLHEHYNGTAAQEQNSLQKGWEVWLRSEFEELRACIYLTKDEFDRFRKVLVRQVIATDMFSPDLAKARLDRWNEAFSGANDKATASRKATAMLEVLIQAADISHTMQSWTRYTKWNSMLFEEMRGVYKLGLLEKDPSEGWFEGEMKFFDSVVLPLADRIVECGVIGCFGDEYLSKAQANRRKWEETGKNVLNGWMTKYRSPAKQPQKEVSVARTATAALSA